MDFREFYQKPSIFRAKSSFQLFLAVLFQTLIDSFWEEIFTYPEGQFWMITFLQKNSTSGVDFAFWKKSPNFARLCSKIE